MPKNLWAPWRMEYIKADKCDEEGCFLCKAAESKDELGCLVIHRTQRCVCVLNRFPYNNGHVLVAPCAHKADFNELDDAERLEIMQAVGEMERRLRKVMQPHGFNIGVNIGDVGGAGLPGHLHFHIVPRWSGDTNFMAVVGDTKVIPQSLNEVLELLRGAGGE